MTEEQKFANLVGLLVIYLCLQIGCAADHKRKIGPFPGFFGNQQCVKQEGVTTSCDQSSFLLTCGKLSQVKTCYYKYAAQNRKYLDKFFNATKFIPAYTTMCTELHEYVKQNGLFNLRRLESDTLRRNEYKQANAKLMEYAKENNRSEIFIATVCMNILTWAQQAESFLAGDDQASLRATMHDTLMDSFTDTCRAHLVPTTLFPSLFDITLSKPGKVCMDPKVPQWSYLYDRKIKCDKATDTQWGHLSCGRAEQTLTCISTYFTNNNFKPDTDTYVTKFLFDLNQQRRAFTTYCAQPKDVRERLQCVSSKLVNSFRKFCYKPWIVKITSILSRRQNLNDKLEVCQLTKNKISCEKNILSSGELEAATLYAKLQRDSLPRFCSDTEISGSNTRTRSTKSSDTNINTYREYVVVIAFTCAVVGKFMSS